MSPFRTASIASASGDEMIITTGVICSTIHCLMLAMPVGPDCHLAPRPPQNAAPLLHRRRLCAGIGRDPRPGAP